MRSGSQLCHRAQVALLGWRQPFEANPEEALVDYGTAVLQEQTDATMAQAAGTTRFDGSMGPSTKVRVVYDVIGHTWDISGQMVVYLRPNGVTPPGQRF